MLPCTYYMNVDHVERKVPKYITQNKGKGKGKLLPMVISSIFGKSFHFPFPYFKYLEELVKLFKLLEMRQGMKMIRNSEQLIMKVTLEEGDMIFSLDMEGR